jgi:hypothetical protein
VDFVKRAVSRTVERVFNMFKNSTKKRWGEQMESNRQTIRAYEEGLAELKRYEVH